MGSRGVVNSWLQRWPESGFGSMRARDVSKGRGSGFDWRKNFCSIFVGNLKPDITSGELWKVFSEYGVVCDVFVKQRMNRQSAFAFIRYRKNEEISKAIQLGNGQEIGGWTIVVKQEEVQPKNGKSVLARNDGHALFERNQRTREAGGNKVHGELSFAEATRNDDRVGFKPPVRSTTGDDHTETNRSSEQYVQVLHVKSDVDENPPEWLLRSAVGKMKEFMPLPELQEELDRNGIPVPLSVLGGLTVLITFYNRELMEYLMDQHMDFFDQRFSKFRPWEENFVCDDMFLWITVTGIPIQFWREDLFKEVGNAWGTFISMDASTTRRCRLDCARFLIAVSSKTMFPTTLMIRVKDRSFLIRISQKPADDFLSLISDRKLPVADNVPAEEVGDCSVSKEGERAKVGMMDGNNASLHGMDSEVENGGLCMGMMSPEMHVGRKSLSSEFRMGEAQSVASPLNVFGPIGMDGSLEQAEQVEGTVVQETNEQDMCPILRQNDLSPRPDPVCDFIQDPFFGQRMERALEVDPDLSRAFCLVEENAFIPQEHLIEEQLLNNNRMKRRGASRKGKKRRNTVDVYGDAIPSAMEVSNYSLSDDDIARRMTVCRREANAICEISSKIGVVYDGDGVAAMGKILLRKEMGQPVAD